MSASSTTTRPLRFRRSGLVLALASAALILTVEVAAVAFAALGGPKEPVDYAIYALAVGAVAGLLAPLAILVSRQSDAVALCVISISVTLLALLFGFLIWAGAASIACHGATDCPFG